MDNLRLILVLALISTIATGCMMPMRSEIQVTEESTSTIIREAEMEPQLQLVFSILGKEFKAGNDYQVRVELFNNSIKGQVMSTTGSMGDLFDVVTLDKNNNPVTIDKQIIEAINEGDGRCGRTAQKIRIRFQKPGEYKIFGRTKNALVRISEPTQHTIDKPVNLKTEPVLITVK